MLLNLINITKEDIEISSEESISDDNSIVMYLQNNGIQDYRWYRNDINKWINEDIES